VLIKRSAELAPRLRQILLQGICFQSQSIPLFLKYTEQRGDGGECGRSGPNDALRLDFDQIVGGEVFAVHRILAILSNVSLNEALLEDAACKLLERRDLRFRGWEDLPLLEETTGT
jgi:hypothetical protein